MTKQTNQEAISKIILSSLSPGATSLSLTLLQEFYESTQLPMSEHASEEARKISSKIFGTELISIKTNNLFEVPISAHLTALAQIILLISFEDPYIMNILMEEINQSQKSSLPLKNLPYACLSIPQADLKNILLHAISQINEWRKTFTIHNIIKRYYVASDILGLFLRKILLKLGFADAEDCQNPLINIAENYQILFEYFDLNVIAKFQQNAELFMFPDFHLFILTCDHKEFCTGKYYENEQVLLRVEQNMRRSTFERILEDQKGKKSQLPGANCENSLRNSLKFDLNLGESTNGFGLNFGQTVLDTPYFSDQSATPQFGMESLKFGKSTNFESAVEQLKQKQGHKNGTSFPKNKNNANQSEFFMNFKFNSVVINEEEDEQAVKEIKNNEKFDQIENKSFKSSGMNKEIIGLIHMQKSFNSYKECESERQSEEVIEEKVIERGSFLQSPPKFEIIDPMTPSVADHNECFLHPLKSSGSNKYFETHKTELLREPNHFSDERMTEFCGNWKGQANKKRTNFVESPRKEKRKYSNNYGSSDLLKFENTHASSYLDARGKQSGSGYLKNKVNDSNSSYLGTIKSNRKQMKIQSNTVCFKMDKVEGNNVQEEEKKKKHQDLSLINVPEKIENPEIQSLKIKTQPSEKKIRLKGSFPEFLRNKNKCKEKKDNGQGSEVEKKFNSLGKKIKTLEFSHQRKLSKMVDHQKRNVGQFSQRKLIVSKQSQKLNCFHQKKISNYRERVESNNNWKSQPRLLLNPSCLIKFDQQRMIQNKNKKCHKVFENTTNPILFQQKNATFSNNSKEKAHQGMLKHTFHH